MRNHKLNLAHSKQEFIHLSSLISPLMNMKEKCLIKLKLLKNNIQKGIIDHLYLQNKIGQKKTYVIPAQNSRQQNLACEL